MTPSSSHCSQAPLSSERRGGSLPNSSPSNAAPGGANPFPASSNFLARAFHQAIVGSEVVSRDAPIKGDTVSVLRLIDVATAAELDEAILAMRAAYGYDLSTYLGAVTGQEQRSLVSALQDKGISSETLSCPSNGDRLRLEFLRRELERANIFPIKVIPKPIEEKLELLDAYLDRLGRGLERYPEMLHRLRRSQDRQVELKIEVTVNLVDSIKRGDWKELGEHSVSPESVIEHADRCTKRARELVNELQRCPFKMTASMLNELVTNLDVSTRITHLFARDLFQEAQVNLAEAKPTGLWEKFWGAKPTEACEAAHSALSTRQYLILRAIGVRAFVDHMRESLQMT